jgi:hypothetical protein
MNLPTGFGSSQLGPIPRILQISLDKNPAKGLFFLSHGGMLTRFSGIPASATSIDWSLISRPCLSPLFGGTVRL